jgi:transcriptional regulator with XRE-family HTH domain
MKLSETIKKVREAKGLSQKQVATAAKMQQAQYSRIESGKTDPSFSLVMRIAKALGVTLTELFKADEIFTDVKSADKTLMEKLRLIDTLDDQEKQSLFNIVDSLVAKKKLKDNLTNVLQLAQ